MFQVGAVVYKHAPLGWFPLVTPVPVSPGYLCLDTDFTVTTLDTPSLLRLQVTVVPLYYHHLLLPACLVRQGSMCSAVLSLHSSCTLSSSQPHLHNGPLTILHKESYIIHN